MKRRTRKSMQSVVTKGKKSACTHTHTDRERERERETETASKVVADMR